MVYMDSILSYLEISKVSDDIFLGSCIWDMLFIWFLPCLSYLLWTTHLIRSQDHIENLMQWYYLIDFMSGRGK